MSCNREHDIWQSQNGSWSIGFYAFDNVNESDPDWDYEWDVLYRHGEFFWASSGHSSPEAAFKAWRGANPGYKSAEVPYLGKENIEECERLDSVLREYLATR